MSKGKPRLDKKLLSQYLLVFLAFFLMVMISNYYAGDIVSEHLATYGEEAITASAETLQTYFDGHQTTFEDVAYVVEDFYGEGAGVGEIEEELRKWNTRLHGNDARYQGFLYIYGVIEGRFVEGSSWEERPPDYDPFNRPWYIGAVEHDGQTFYCDPYIDERTDEWIMSLSKVLHDLDGNPFGVLAFDVFLSKIADYVNGMQLMNHGYGVLLDSELRFIVHPDESVFGVKMDDLHDEIAVLMRTSNTLGSYQYTAISGVDSVLFSRKLFNGWYLYVAAPHKDYYRDVNVMFIVLSLAGLLSTVVLCCILTLMHRAMARSDEANKRAKSMLDATPFGCKMWDKDLRIFDCNREAVKLFGLQNEQEFINRFSELSPERQPDGALSSGKAATLLKKAFSEGKQVFEWMHQLPDGTPLPSEITLVRVNYGDDIALAGYIPDLREYKAMMAEIDKRNEMIKEALNEAQNASTAKSSFLANMSHEIRTPMNTIIGMMELLQKEELTERQAGYVGDVNRSAHSLLSIINDILDLSKVEAGKLELIPVDYDFRAFIDHVRSMFLFAAEQRGLEFRVEYEGESPQYLFGDDIRLRQVINNICGNAMKFTEKGYVRLKVINAGETLAFEVRDTGRGIKKQDIAKLFDAFQQSDAIKNRGIGGTGLGLSISSALIKMMGGTITVESEYGKGTAFLITIPLVLGSEDGVKAINKQDEQPLCAPDAKILVVDDNEFNLKVASGLLRLSQIEAKTAPGGKEAIEMIRREDFDVVFMDHMMPEMDGVEATAAIRALGGKYETLPIIALTANAIYGAKEMFLASGFSEFLSKPIDVSKLHALLREWLPPEKLGAETENEPEEPKEEAGGFLEALRKVEGIDTEIGLGHVMGQENIYYEFVKDFYQQIQRECGHMTSCLAGGDIGGFAISVHGMKSVLATVGAAALSAAALELEMAAKDKDEGFCNEKYPGFRDSLLGLYERLSGIF